MAKTRKQMKADYHKRKERYRLPSYVLFFIGISLFLTGLWIKYLALLILGIVTLGIAIILYTCGDTLSTQIFKK